jgi:hypothetical protein
MIKTTEGFFDSYSVEDFDAKSRAVYDEYFERIDRLVPSERKLVYQLGQGWEPLCEFLDKPVPEVDFPQINESKALREHQRAAMERWLTASWRAARPWVIGVVGVGIAAFIAPRVL